MSHFLLFLVRRQTQDSVQTRGLYSPWNSPGQNPGVGSLIPSPGDLPDPGIETGSPVLQADSLSTELLGKPLFIPRAYSIFL